MNLASIIRSIEEVIVEVVLWFVLIPKTLAKLITSPAWSMDYVTAEFARPAEQRFDEYLSPVTLWLVLGVIPCFWAMAPIAHFLGEDAKEQVFVLAVSLAVLPLGFAIGLLAAQGQRITRSNLRPLFYAQCYCFTPVVVLALPAVLMTNRPDAFAHLPRFLGEISIAIGLTWLFFAEIVTIRRTLQTTWMRALLLFFPFLFASYMVAWAAGSIVAFAWMAANESRFG